MNYRIVSLTLLTTLLASCNVIAQGDFFFSFTAGGANSDQSMDFDVGDTGSLWVYWSTNGPADSDLDLGAIIDVFSSTSGVIEFTAAETFDFDIEVVGYDVGNRLCDANGGGCGLLPGDVSADLVDELAAFTVAGGPGILEENNGSGVFLDTGYDAANDGFLWGRVDFNVIGEGETNITGAAGDGLILDGGEQVNAVFTTATITAGNAVPEPTSAIVLAITLVGLTNRRIR